MLALLQVYPCLRNAHYYFGFYVTTAIVISAHFTAYTYIEPFMIDIGHLDPNFATVVLLVLILWYCRKSII